MAQILHSSRERISRSVGVSRSVSAYRIRCVSRFSIPLQSRAHDVAFDLELPLERSDKLRRLGTKWRQFGHGFTVFRDDNAFRPDAIEDRQTLFLEFGCRNSLHLQHFTI